MNSDPQGISGLREGCKVNRTFRYKPEEDSSQPHTRPLKPQEQLIFPNHGWSLLFFLIGRERIGNSDMRGGAACFSGVQR